MQACEQKLTPLGAPSIGLAIIDTLDIFVHDGRMEPQLAMKVLSSFDRAITEVLAGQVKARLNFKVRIQTSSIYLLEESLAARKEGKYRQ